MGGEETSPRLGTLVRRIDRHPDGTTVALAGELDAATTPHARDVLEAECRRGARRLRVDLAQVEFMDASALHIFATLESRLAAEGRTLELVGPASPLRRIISLTGLESLLAPDEASADEDGARSRP